MIYEKERKNDLLSTLRSIKYGTTEEKKVIPDLEEFVLMEEKVPIKEFCCGECDSELTFDLYLRIEDKKRIKHIICKGCGLELWNK